MHTNIIDRVSMWALGGCVLLSACGQKKIKLERVEKSKPSFFRKNIAISYPNAKRKYFAVYVKDYLVKK